MDRKTFESKRRSVETPSGRIGYVEHGDGPVALFVHGVSRSSHLRAAAFPILRETSR